MTKKSHAHPRSLCGILKENFLQILEAYPLYESINTLQCSLCSIMRTNSRRWAISKGYW